MFYVYAWLRTDGTPYYIGKGSGNRAFDQSRKMSPTVDRVVILEGNLTEVGAFAIERRLIRRWGRKDLGTGILHNRTDGGEGATGARHTILSRLAISKFQTGRKRSEVTKQNMSNAQTGRKKSAEHVEKIASQKRGKPGTPHTEETKLVISNKKKGRPNPGASTALKGRSQTEEHKINAAIARSTSVHTPYGTFYSSGEASRKLDIPVNQIRTLVSKADVLINRTKITMHPLLDESCLGKTPRELGWFYE